MSFLRNKHLITAMFVTPLLAIAGYYVADRSVAEPPVAIEPDRSYPLVARSNCRYQSGLCTLVNGDVKLTVNASRVSEHRVALSVVAEQPLDRVVIASTPDEPVVMKREGNVWKNEMTITDPESTQLQLVFTLNGAHFFAETSAVFVDYSTGFSRKNIPGKM